MDEIGIGTRCTHIFSPDKGILRVVGTKEIPYNHRGLGAIYPIEPNEVLLIPEITNQELEPFIHAMKAHLNPIPST
jgi:hypothetical protein